MQPLRHDDHVDDIDDRNGAGDEVGETEEEDDDDEEAATNADSALQDCIDALDDVIEQVPATYLDHITYENYDHIHNTTTQPTTAVHDQHNSNTSDSTIIIIPPISQQQPLATNHSSSIGMSTQIDADVIDRLLLEDDAVAAGNLLYDQQLQQQQQESIATDQLYIFSALEQWIAHPEPIHPHIHDPIIYHHYTSSSSYMNMDSFGNEAAMQHDVAAAAIDDDVKHYIGAGDSDHIGHEAADQLRRYFKSFLCVLFFGRVYFSVNRCLRMVALFVFSVI